MPPMAFTGMVTKVGCMNKTATVTVYRNVVHKITGKRIERTTKILTHDEDNVLRLHDKVLIRNCPPISARKRFRLEKVLNSPETVRELAHAQSVALLYVCRVNYYGVQNSGSAGARIDCVARQDVFSEFSSRLDPLGLARHRFIANGRVSKLCSYDANFHSWRLAQAADDSRFVVSRWYTAEEVETA